MKLSNVKTVASVALHRTGLKFKKASPEILLGVGVVSIIGGTVMACMATLKADEVLSIHEENMESIAEATEKADDYTEDDRKKDLALVYTQTAVRFTKLYAPAGMLIVGGIGCIMASHGIMKKRNAALTTAYMALDTAFKDYRKRVAKLVGEDEEQKIYLNADDVRKELVPDLETGETQEMTTVEGKHIQFSQYAKCFDEKSCMWKRNANENLRTLHFLQNQMNDMLRINGHVFLNEVYDALDIPRTQEGALVGWVKDPKPGTGDSYIDFGIYNIKSEACRDFVNGYEYSIWLDFNVQGAIYNLI